MSYTYLLAGEDMELAEAELKGFLQSQQIDEIPERRGKLALTEAKPSQLKRLALVHEVAEVIERNRGDEFNFGYTPENSFALRAFDVNSVGFDTSRVEEEAGEKLSAQGNQVDLENPEEELRLYLLEDEWILARLVEDIQRGLFEKRSNENREFSSPVSLDPVIARVLVNLAEVPAGSHLLDPFCGTGGILIEAGLCGVGVHGLDVSREMVEGTQENLEQFGVIVHDIRQGEVKNADEIFDREFDAVVTDLPYGNASKIKGRPVDEFLEVVPRICDGKTVFIYNEPTINDLEADHEIYIHKNLTRYVYVV